MNMHGIKTRRVNADSIIRNASRMVEEIMESSNSIFRSDSYFKECSSPTIQIVNNSLIV